MTCPICTAKLSAVSEALTPQEWLEAETEYWAHYRTAHLHIQQPVALTLPGMEAVNV